MIIFIKERNGLWGYYDTTNNKKLPCIYEEVGKFVDGFAIARKDSKHYGIIDLEGEPIVSFIYTSIVRETSKIFLLSINGVKGECNTTGKFLNKENKELDEFYQKFDIVEQLYTDLYHIIGNNINGVFYKGKEVIEINEVNNYYCVKCIGSDVIEASSYDFKYDYYKLNGELIVTSYHKARIIGGCIIFDKNNNGYGIVNKEGIIILNSVYEEISYLGRDVFSLKYKDFANQEHIIKFNYRQKGFIGLLDKFQRYVPNIYDWCDSFINNIAIVVKKGKYGYIDENCNELIKCEYDGALRNTGSVGFVKKHDEWFIINNYTKEKRSLGNEFSELGLLKLSDRFYAIYNAKDYNKRYEVIDSYGNIVLPAKYEDVKYIGNNLFEVSPGQIINIYGEIVSKNKDVRDVVTTDLNEEHKIVNKDNKQKEIADKKSEEKIPYYDNGKLEYIEIDAQYEETRREFCDGLIGVRKKGKWGFINLNGKEVIPCQYYSVNDFHENLCVVEDFKFHKGVINSKGVLIVPFGKFSDISDYTQEITCSYSNSTYNGRYASVSNSNIDDEVYEYDDFYGIKKANYNNVNRHIDKNGNLCVLLYGNPFSISSEYEWCDDKFYNGFLSVCRNGKWGVINTRKQEIISCLYDKITRYKDDYAIAIQADIKYVFDSFGNIIFQGPFEKIEFQGTKGIFIGIDKSGKKTYMSLYCNSISGEEFKGRLDKFNYGLNLGSDCAFSEGYGMGGGLLAARKYIEEENRYIYGFMDLHGNSITNLKFSKINPFSHGIAIVKQYLKDDPNNEKWGLLSLNGEMLTNFVYDKVSELDNGDIIVSNKHGRSNIFTEDGMIKLSYGSDYIYLKGFDWCSEFHDTEWNDGSFMNKGYAIAIQGDKQCIISANDYFPKVTFPLTEMGEVEIDFNGKDEYDKNDIIFKKKGETRKVNSNGEIITYFNNHEIILPKGIYWCTEWKDNYLEVESNGKWGLIDSELNFILEINYTTVQYIGAGKVLCKIKKDESVYNDFYEIKIYDIFTSCFRQLDYDNCSPFINGFSVVYNIKRLNPAIKYTIGPNTYIYETKKTYGLIDINGNNILPCTYDMVSFDEPNYPEGNTNNDEEKYEGSEDLDNLDALYRDAFEDDPDAINGREW